MGAEVGSLNQENYAAKKATYTARLARALSTRLGGFVLAVMCTGAVALSQQATEPVTIEVVPRAAYVEKRGMEQRLNFDLLLHNSSAMPLRINKIQLSVYDAQNALAFRRYLDENGRPSGISTMPQRVVPAQGSLAVFNPFYSFEQEMPLVRLHYEVFFEKTDEKEPNLLNFFSKVEIDVYPKPYPGKTRLVLPLHGLVYVFDGHDFYAHHRRQPVLRDGRYRPNSVRYAYDLMVTNAAGALYQGDRFAKESWLSYGAPIYAAAAGTVVEATNNIPENSYKDGQVVYPENADALDPRGLGNHVILDHGNGEFSIFVHMKPGSVQVKKGDHVKTGQQLGAIGFSGDTFLPHLHYMLMDGVDERSSEGLPSYFDHFKRILGSKTVTVEHGQIDSGEIVGSIDGP